MADVKWIKITTDIFDDEKILLIESLPEADSIIVIWFKLLCLAGKVNNSGVFMLNDKMAYTDKMLATIFRRKESTVRLALETFEEFGMIEIVDDVITIPNWGKHQSLYQLENKKEYMRNYMKEYRQKQKILIGTNKYNEAGLKPKEWKYVLDEFGYKCAYCGTVDDLEQDHVISVNKGGSYTIENIVPACRHCNASKGENEVFAWYKKQDFYDEERCKYLRKYLCKTKSKANVSSLDKNKNKKEKEKENKKENKRDIGCQQIADMYNDTCVSFPRLTSLSEARKKAIKARLRVYSLEDFQSLFEKAEASTFLKGGNDRNWSATFDWLIKDTNMAKVLDGNYDNRGSGGTNKPSNKVAQQLDDFYRMAAEFAESEE